ncbi:protein SLOW GREEN 1, chloroplastic-like isoform X2 [Phragmites australis]|uniref:protein SLOW GREEN 1, chloroplastic-like isoform X2 n=1 Tax=Phragmites australis TaxID=29695 RepID=UPI002D78DD2F|nr:protein SLOW GREEN 1, chloroplastic-like isoform X2 [Phragmites australis]
MAMSFFLSTGSTSILLPIRREPAASPFLSFPLKPRRFSPRYRFPLRPLRFSRIPSSSCKAPTTNVLSSVASASRTLLFLLAAGLLSLSLSGVRPLPALASAPPLTQQPQEIEGQDEQQESKERKQQEEVEGKQEEEDEEKEDMLQQEDDEVRMYSAILSRNPGDVDALKCALYAKMRRADWGGALRYARRLRDAEPGEVEWRLMEAQLHELRGDLAAAERGFREVLAEEPLHIRALHGQLDVASEKLQNLINEDPRDFRPHLCQGIVYALLDKKDAADEQFDTYRSLVPDEFPDKSFINDVILAAKTESNDRIQRDFVSEFLSKK